MVRQRAYQSCTKLYEDYYSSQVGHGLPFFVGRRNSIRGHGLGSLLAGIGRAVVPLLKRGGKVLLKEGARTGLQVAQDVLSGHRVGSALKQRSRQAGKRLLNQATGGGNKRIKSDHTRGRKQTGGGKSKTKQHQQQQQRRRRQQKQKRMSDIFG